MPLMRHGWRATVPPLNVDETKVAERKKRMLTEVRAPRRREIRQNTGMSSSRWIRSCHPESAGSFFAVERCRRTR
ncbi:hypothetical protein GCM10027605_04080 [Micromonospora zhanjiangensis]